MNRLQNLAAALNTAQSMPLANAAPYLASNGWPVFPFAAGGKTPLNEHGLSEASTDAQQVERWWARWPKANIGVATGARSGFDVIDVDLRDTKSGYPAFANATEKFGLDRWMIRVLTPSGGMHYYYPTPQHRIQRNWVCADAAIDFRGAGGAIILPPSVGTCGHDLPAPYSLIETKRAGAAVDSVGLHEFLDPRVAQRKIAASLRASKARVPIGERLAPWVASRPEGERNSGLFYADCRFVEAGQSIEDTATVLVPAAELAGLVEREIMATIRSAFLHTGPLPTVSPAPLAMGVQMIRSR